ncbi:MULTISPECIES: Clp protease N-terminal domain-containing protein [unclassified Streptomyces]|uniref:Clp protease N-terminal domain-containing protein n=1 Tax=unclassified Streptomyces TaxID=2593676 RepID=UPI000F6EE27E|nr:MULTISPECIES: Clp protease N-terminal domain-containing protein [unclassified Streptomyces]AZM60068.1 peptidase [Streptomyces sp. WAC 01438]RSM99829.1 peptidase [Streptomyces sp. WAC 01420]
MFERFTKDARDVVKGAVAQAERAGALRVDSEHLLLALLDREGSRASFALGALGLTERREPVRAALEQVRRRGGLTQAETDALAGLGIDVPEIVARVEEAHGTGALSGALSGGKDGARRSGHRPFGRDAKAVLTGALRAATARRDRRIGDEHLLLALTARPGAPAEVLADHGVTYESVTRVLYGNGGEMKAG